MTSVEKFFTPVGKWRARPKSPALAGFLGRPEGQSV